MYDPNTRGTYADWTGALLAGLSVFGAATFYVVDRLRDRRVQAGSVVVWLHPHEHGPPMLKMSNHSDKPIFDHGFLITAKATPQIVRLARKGWAHQCACQSSRAVRLASETVRGRSEGAGHRAVEAERT
jgi:hypothetical protein